MDPESDVIQTRHEEETPYVAVGAGVWVRDGRVEELGEQGTCRSTQGRTLTGDRSYSERVPDPRPHIPQRPSSTDVQTVSGKEDPNSS